MARSAHEIPVLLAPAPVQCVIRFQILVGVEIKPTLAALLPWPRIPGDAQHLQFSAGQFDQVLLQGIHAKGKANLIVSGFATISIGVYKKFSISQVKPGDKFILGERRVVEVTQYSRRACHLHCLGMVRLLPLIGLGLMARVAFLRANIVRQLDSSAWQCCHCHHCRHRGNRQRKKKFHAVSASTRVGLTFTTCRRPK